MPLATVSRHDTHLPDGRPWRTTPDPRGASPTYQYRVSHAVTDEDRRPPAGLLVSDMGTHGVPPDAIPAMPPGVAFYQAVDAHHNYADAERWLLAHDFGHARSWHYEALGLRDAHTDGEGHLVHRYLRLFRRGPELVARGLAEPFRARFHGEQSGLRITGRGSEAVLAFEHLAGERAAEELGPRDFERMEAQALRARGVRAHHPMTLGPTGERARTYFMPHPAASPERACKSCRRGHTPGEHRGHKIDSASHRVGLVGQRYGNPRRNPDYSMAHGAPGSESAPLSDLTANHVYPPDVYETLHHYGSGSSADYEVEGLVRRYRGKPNAGVWIFRAVPPGVTTINPGDWVAIRRGYARDHGRHNDDPSRDMPVIAARVQVRDVHTNGDSLEEWGYNGAVPIKGRIVWKYRPPRTRAPAWKPSRPFGTSRNPRNGDDYASSFERATQQRARELAASAAAEAMMGPSKEDAAFMARQPFARERSKQFFGLVGARVHGLMFSPNSDIRTMDSISALAERVGARGQMGLHAWLKQAATANAGSDGINMPYSPFDFLTSISPYVKRKKGRVPFSDQQAKLVTGKTVDEWFAWLDGKQANPGPGKRPPLSCDPSARPLPRSVIGAHVRVHLNLHNGCYVISINRKVVGYAHAVELSGVTTSVSAAGYARCRDEGVRNVHAWLDGVLESADPAPPPEGARRLSYNCLTKPPCFYFSDTGDCFKRSDRVLCFPAGRVFSVSRARNPRRANHPALTRPVDVQVFLREFVALWKRSGLRGQPKVTLTDRLDRRHARQERSYAEVDVAGRHFYFANAVLRLPPENRKALLAHEVGHVLHPRGGEVGADEAAQRVLGVTVRYDPRWHGVAQDGTRGLQTTRRRIP
jgi:hypothetical protein